MAVDVVLPRDHRARPPGHRARRAVVPRHDPPGPARAAGRVLPARRRLDGAWTFDALRASGAAGLAAGDAQRGLPAGARSASARRPASCRVHVWLPRAHPAAPSHVSALMSAVMVKLGIYGLLRVGLDLLGGGPAWWGALAAWPPAPRSALTGVLYALVDDDLKRLLAYSTVENIGVIVLGDRGRVPVPQPRPADGGRPGLRRGAPARGEPRRLQGRALPGRRRRCCTRPASATSNRLGGLVKRMPWTAATFLVGALSIAALPPFNGFVSEWLLFQSFLPGVASSRASVAVLLTLGVGALALTGGLAAATFVKAFGISFLAMPALARGRDAPTRPAGPCAPAWSCSPLACPALAVAHGSRALGDRRRRSAGLGGLPAASTTFSLGVIARDPAGARRACRRSPSWPCSRRRDCGVVAGDAARRPRQPPDRRHLGLRAHRPDAAHGIHVDGVCRAAAPHLRRAVPAHRRPDGDRAPGFAVPHPGDHVPDASCIPWFERGIYDPLVRATQAAAARVRALQSGSINAYLAYIVAGAGGAAGHGDRVLGDDDVRHGGHRGGDRAGAAGARAGAGAGRVHPLAEGPAAEPAGRADLAAVLRAAEAVPQGDGRLAATRRGSSTLAPFVDLRQHGRRVPARAGARDAAALQRAWRTCSPSSTCCCSAPCSWRWPASTRARRSAAWAAAAR